MPENCLPGDITVMRIPTGFLVGRALAHRGPGRWWEYVFTVVSFRQAIIRAHKLARTAGVKAWLHIGLDTYEPLPRWKKRRRRTKPKVRQEKE